MKRKLNHIVIHCAATPNGKHFTAADIDRMHKQRGFKRDSQAARNFNPELKHIGYHYVIELDGSVQPGRHVEEIGAHVQGSNARSIGICMIGTDKFTRQQWESLRNTIIGLAATIRGTAILSVDNAMFHLKDMGIAVKGHRDFSPDKNGNGIIERHEWLKICPGFSVADWIKGGMLPMEAHIHVAD